MKCSSPSLHHRHHHLYFSPPQAIALLIGIIYFRQQLTQEGVTNINGALFLLLTNMTFQNVFGVINVSQEMR
ncbi:Protein white [Portunus trituberculatus]|uniref:Protein white n=1 Tax=Portunus trituberculatus TaxID=210409 RepID=A0A5B7JT46_PORTR|nr:Protein white [Portunus trituberculatus]